MCSAVNQLRKLDYKFIVHQTFLLLNQPDTENNQDATQFPQKASY